MRLTMSLLRKRFSRKTQMCKFNDRESFTIHRKLFSFDFWSTAAGRKSRVQNFRFLLAEKPQPKKLLCNFNRMHIPIGNKRASNADIVIEIYAKRPAREARKRLQIC